MVQIPLLLHLLDTINYPHDELSKELSEGFNLLGNISPGVNWPSRSDERYSNPSDIDSFYANNIRYMHKKATSHCMHDEHSETILQEILKEVDSGKMSGPYEAPPQWNFVADSIPGRPLLQTDTWPISGAAAFPIVQIGSDGKHKIRRGEDWRRGHQNKTISASDSPTHFCLDDISTAGKRCFTSEFSNQWAPGQQDGEEAEQQDRGDLLVWGHDHESAYRQLPVKDTNNAYVLHRVGQKKYIFRHAVLLFGAVSSVWGYNRFADSIVAVARCIMLLICGHYVDDFAGIEWATSAMGGFLAFAEMGRIIGTTMKESKAQPPANEHKLLGARIGFVGHPTPMVRIRPDADRITKISEEIKTCLDNDHLSPRMASKLCGKINFLSCSLFGRSSNAATKPLYCRANATGSSRLTESMRCALRFLLALLSDPSPREGHLGSATNTKVSLVYADAFFEAGDLAKTRGSRSTPMCDVARLRNGWGCVVIPDKNRVDIGIMIRGEIPHDIVSTFADTGAYIYFLEAIAQIIPVLVLQDKISRHYISFIDNEAAKHALVKGYGSVAATNKSISYFWGFCQEHRLHPWFERVTTQANIADAISRDDTSEGLRRGWVLLEPDLQGVYSKLRDLGTNPHFAP
jgi:hypothetical protein